MHSDHFYIAFSSPLILRSAPNTAQILCWSFTTKRHRQLWVKDLPKVPTWRLERESNPRPSGWKLMACFQASFWSHSVIIKVCCVQLASDFMFVCLGWVRSDAECSEEGQWCNALIHVRRIRGNSLTLRVAHPYSLVWLRFISRCLSHVAKYPCVPNDLREQAILSYPLLLSCTDIV